MPVSEADRCFIDYVKGKNDSHEDPDMAFFRSVPPNVYSMDASKKRSFKREVLSLIDRILTPPPPLSSSTRSYSSSPNVNILPPVTPFPSTALQHDTQMSLSLHGSPLMTFDSSPPSIQKPSHCQTSDYNSAINYLNTYSS